MKFYGNGIVWDAEKDKPLCKFVDGVFETSAKRTISKLNDLGYANDGSTAGDQETTTPPADSTGSTANQSTT